MMAPKAFTAAVLLLFIRSPTARAAEGVITDTITEAE
jgi:hypothetical protein